MTILQWLLQLPVLYPVSILENWITSSNSNNKFNLVIEGMCSDVFQHKYADGISKIQGVQKDLFLTIKYFEHFI